MARNVVLNGRAKLGGFIIVFILLSALMLLLPGVPVAQAAPANGVYDIAVLKVGGLFGWGGWRHWTDDDFTQLTVEPGIENYNWNTIPTTDLTAVGLADYDVLIVPHTHGYDWLDSAAKKQAIVDWVNGGKLLIVHSYYDISQPELINDPLMAAFGEDYRVDWVGTRYGWPSDNPWIADADNPLVSTPNTLTGGQTGDLGSWQRGVQNTIDPATAGSSWNWAASSTWFKDGTVGTVHWLGYALSESGAIVVLGGNPEQHSTEPYQGSDRIREGARKLIENEIAFEFEPPVIEVEIDIKPGSFPNSVNPNSKGVIPVAILTTMVEDGDSIDFDAATVAPGTVEFGPAGATPRQYALEDVDGDGDLDMILHFRIQDTGIEAGDTEATLNGETEDGTAFTGTDSMRTVPAKGNS